jgi:hypothetical protein
MPMAAKVMKAAQAKTQAGNPMALFTTEETTGE